MLLMTNLVEKVFGLAEFIFDKLKQSVQLIKLYMQSFLKMNKNLWENGLISYIFSFNE